MKHKVNGLTYFYQWLTDYQAELPTLVCLHGFTGTSESFRRLAQTFPEFNVLGIDLIGHGQTDSLVHPYRYQLACLTADLHQLLSELELQPFALLGYSMGARVALSFTLTYPDAVSHLILESGSPGLATKKERTQRQHSDRLLAQRLLTKPLIDFVNFWEKLPLFHSQQRLSGTEQQQIRLERLGQNHLGLAVSLWAMGTGRQPNYWPDLKYLATVPVLLISGAEDLKFQKIAKKMTLKQPLFANHIVPEAGHAVHLEQLDLFSLLIKNWLQGAHVHETH